jgi:hypothetical protein
VGVLVSNDNHCSITIFSLTPLPLRNFYVPIRSVHFYAPNFNATTVSQILNNGGITYISPVSANQSIECIENASKRNANNNKFVLTVTNPRIFSLCAYVRVSSCCFDIYPGHEIVSFCFAVCFAQSGVRAAAVLGGKDGVCVE